MNDKLWHERYSTIEERAGFRAYIVLDDLTPVRGNFASGDDALDKKMEDEIIYRLERGDNLAWCGVVVEVERDGFGGIASVWACSFKDDQDPYIKDVLADLTQEAEVDRINTIKEAVRRGEAARAILKDNGAGGQ